MALGRNSEGKVDKRSVPSANLIAISQELAAERYNSDVLDANSPAACLFNFSGAPALHRKTLVSSRYFTASF